jgi:hypothetical protein
MAYGDVQGMGFFFFSKSPVMTAVDHERFKKNLGSEFAGPSFSLSTTDDRRSPNSKFIYTETTLSSWK